MCVKINTLKLSVDFITYFFSGKGTYYEDKNIIRQHL